MSLDSVRAFLQSELGYIVLLFVLFVIPRILQRWRIPSAITAFAVGVICSMGLGAFSNDATVHLLATFGIVGLFLFAGLDVDVSLLRREARVVSQHLALRLVLLAGATLAVMHGLGLDVRASVIVALALLTPSTGFILDSLDRFGLTGDERRAVKSKAIATEVLALAVLFFVLQSMSPLRLLAATAALAAMVFLLPVMFRLFAEKIAPHAPKSEFAFLLMMAVLAAYATRQLGVYYLVGAFLVGILARRFRESLPALASDSMLHAVEVFASFFAPFYFFSAGAALRPTDFSLGGLGLGLLFLVAAVPIAAVVVILHRRRALGEPFSQSLRVAAPMVPTLVFTLVLADILRETFEVPSTIVGGLIVYTVLNSLVPSLAFGASAFALDVPSLPVESCAPVVEESVAAATPASDEVTRP